MFDHLHEDLLLRSEKIIYSEENHRLKWLNIVIGNIKNNV